LEEKLAAAVYKTENTAVGICCADHAKPSILKSSPTSGGRSIGIVHSQTKATNFFFLFPYNKEYLCMGHFELPSRSQNTEKVILPKMYIQKYILKNNYSFEQQGS
jgi:hypothetical protein